MKALLSVFLFVFLCYTAKGQNTTDSLLADLKTEILKKKVYDREKEVRINMLRKKLFAIPKSNISAQYSLYDKIYNEYKDYKFDSAYAYSEKSLHLSILMDDLQKQYDSKIKLGAIQLSVGMIKDTFDDISNIKVNLMADSVKLQYYTLKSRALHDVSNYYRQESYNRPNHAKSAKALDSALLLSKPGSYDNYRHAAELLTGTGHRDSAIMYYNTLLNNPTLTNHQRAMVAYDLSTLRRRRAS